MRDAAPVLKVSKLLFNSTTSHPAVYERPAEIHWGIVEHINIFVRFVRSRSTSVSPTPKLCCPWTASVDAVYCGESDQQYGVVCDLVSSSLTLVGSTELAVAQPLLQGYSYLPA